MTTTSTLTVWLSPVFQDAQFFDNNGNILAGGKIFSYAAGSFTTEQPTYTDATGTTPNTNPLVLNSAGRLTTQLWLDSTLVYNLVLVNQEGVVLKAEDGVTGVPVFTNTSGTNTLWQLGGTPTYVSTTQFLLAGDLTVQFAAGNRVRILNSDGNYQYGTISNVTFSDGNTHVSLINDGGVLTTLMTQVFWSEIVATGLTGDAGAISYEPLLPYSSSGTVGSAIKQGGIQIAALQAALGYSQTVYTTTSPGGGVGAFAINPSPAVTSLTQNAIWTVAFNDTVVAGTLNVNGLGAKPLVKTTKAGTFVPAPVCTGMVTPVAWDGTNFQVLSPLPDVTVPVIQTSYLGTSFATGQTYTLPDKTVGVFVYAAEYGGSSRGGTGALEVYDSAAALMATIPFSGTNINNGNDGGSGMVDSAGTYVPMSVSAHSIKFVNAGGANGVSSFVLYAVTQLL